MGVLTLRCAESRHVLLTQIADLFRLHRGPADVTVDVPTGLSNRDTRVIQVLPGAQDRRSLAS
jgi:hypothetical protein